MLKDRNSDFEIIQQRLTDGSYVFAVQIHWGISKRITLQVIDKHAANNLLNTLTSSVSWIEDDEEEREE